MGDLLRRTGHGLSRIHRAGDPAPALRLTSRHLPAAVALAAIVALAGCTDDTEVVTQDEGIPTTTPIALDEVPMDMGEATIEVSGGAFGVNELILQQGDPTILHVTNDDDQPYRLHIGDDLVNDVEIAANGTTDVAFTAPKADTYDGELRSADGTALDEIRVIVQEAGGVVD